MYDQNEAGENAAKVLRSIIDGDVVHMIGGSSCSRFTMPTPFMRDGVPVRRSDVVTAIENQGFRVDDIGTLGPQKRVRIDARPSDSETFIVDRIAVMPNGMTAIVILNAGRIVQFRTSVAMDDLHLQLTRPGDVVTTFSRQGSEEINAFRNRTIEQKVSSW
jgi:hypothetical protein